MKPIDKEILLLKIDSKIEEAQKVFNVAPSSVIGGMIEGYTRTKKIISSLEVKEVDLEHEVESYWKQCDMTWCRDAYSMTHIRSMLSDIAKHFFELGISVNNSTKVTTPDVDDVLKENGVNPDSKEAKIIKESYFMAIEKLAQKGK